VGSSVLAWLDDVEAHRAALQEIPSPYGTGSPSELIASAVRQMLRH
jgi:UDP-N-acetylglucosamine 2-epimerase (non-hydrolysing)